MRNDGSGRMAKVNRNLFHYSITIHTARREVFYALRGLRHGGPEDCQQQAPVEQSDRRLLESKWPLCCFPIYGRRLSRPILGLGRGFAQGAMGSSRRE